MRTNRKTLDKILDLVGEEELQSVVKKYAKSNKDFTYFLQLKFLYLLPTDQPAKKYGAFLSNCFRTYLDRPDKINISATRKIKLYSEELRQQCLDMISLNNYIEAYGIIKNLLLYNSLLIEKTWPGSPKDLLAIHIDILNTYYSLAEQNLARPLKEEMLQELQSLLITGSIKLFDTDFNSLNLLAKLLDGEGKLDLFFAGYYEYLKDQPPRSSLTHTAIRSFLINTGIYSNKNWAEKLYKDNLISSAQIYEQCEFWLKENRLQVTEKLATNAIGFISGRSRGAFYEILCRTKLADGKTKEAIVDLLTFINDPHTTAPMLEKVLKVFPYEFKLEVRKKISANDIIEKLGSKKEKLSIAYLLAWLDYSEELIKLAKKLNSTSIVMPFNKALYKSNPDKLKAFYISYIDNYLENHIGKMSIHYTSKFLEEIKRSGTPKLKDQLNRHISEKFSHRVSVSNL
ncbi:MAG: hypothetical protein EA362_00675 [Saprospirales bacterium]|nr:MAG: hypothetical protein EA362_00675 [Saprospirales bacterium]